MTDSYFMDDMVLEENMASWLDGMMTPEENSDFISRMASTPELVELLDINDDVVEGYETMIDSGYELPDEFYDEFGLPEIHGDNDYFFQENLYGNDNEHFHDGDFGTDIIGDEREYSQEDYTADALSDEEIESDSDLNIDEMAIL